jgi:hypothetical protein
MRRIYQYTNENERQQLANAAASRGETVVGRAMREGKTYVLTEVDYPSLWTAARTDTERIQLLADCIGITTTQETH